MLIGVGLAGAVVLPSGRAALGSGADGPTGPSRPVERHVIRPGETLWEIARSEVGDEGDPRPLIERIRKVNGLTPADVLLPGISLVVPAA
jgi:nucleoid-associated protein YgaU